MLSSQTAFTFLFPLAEKSLINSEISSELFNYCNDDNEQEIIVDNTIFLDALFILKLNNSLTDLNAEVSQDFNVIYDIGEAFNGDYCLDAIEYLPELSNDNLTYKYRFGLSINSPGEYCIVNARNSSFNLEQENNAQHLPFSSGLNDIRRDHPKKDFSHITRALIFDLILDSRGIMAFKSQNFSYRSSV